MAFWDLLLRTCRPGTKMGFGPPARSRKKIAPEIGPEIGPAEKIEKKWGKIRIFRVLSYFFPIFSAGPSLGPISGAIFFLFWAGGPKPIFYQKPRFSNLLTFSFARNSFAFSEHFRLLSRWNFWGFGRQREEFLAFWVVSLLFTQRK